MSENEFLNALKEEMPEDFGRELLAQLKAEEKRKVKPFPAFWTVAAASIVTVLLGFLLFMNRQPNEEVLSTMMQAWQVREPITAENVQYLEPLLTIGHGQAQAIALSPDMNTLAVATTTGIYLHDAHDLDASPIFLGLPADVEFGVGYYATQFLYLEYTEDGRLFTLVKDSSELRLYEYDDANRNFVRRYTLGSPWMVVQAVDLSPDGTKLLLGTCSNNGGDLDLAYCLNEAVARIQVIDLTTASDIFFRMPRRMSNAIAAMNPDWTQLVYEEDSKVRLYDLASGETVDLLLIGNANGNDDQVMRSEEMHRLYFSPDGRQIGIIDASGKPMDWWEISELQAYTRTTRQYGTDMYGGVYMQSRPITALNPLSDQYLMISGSSLYILDYDDRQILGSLRTIAESEPMSYAISSDGQRVYSLDQTGLIRVWDWETLALEALSLRYTLGGQTGFSASDDGNRFVTNYYGSGLNYAYDISGLNVDQSFLETGENIYQYSYANTMSHDGRYVAFYQEYAVWLYDMESQSSHRIAVVNSQYSPPREPYLTFREDGALLMLEQNEMNESGQVTVFMPEDLASGDVIYPLESYQLPNGLNSDTEYRFISGFSPDGRMLLQWHCELEEAETEPRKCHNPSLKLFDTFTWELVADLATSVEVETYFANFFFSQDSQKIFFAYCPDIADVGWTCDAKSRVLEIWDISELDTSNEPYLRVNTLEDVDSQVITVLSYTDGSFLFTTWSWAHYDEAEREFVPHMIFWQLGADGSITELRRLPMRQVVFAPDGSYFLTAKDGLIELWGVPANVASND